MDKLLKELCDAHGGAGAESGVAAILEREFRKAGLKVHVDRFGNVIGKKETRGGKKTVMLGAHMDEISMMVRSVNKNGFIRFIKIGGIDDRILLNQRVIIHTKKGKLVGVIGNKPPHIQTEEEMKKVVESKKMFIDLGAKNDKDAEKLGVMVGDYITFDMDSSDLANGLVTGRALDDRIGCFVLAEIARKAKSNANIILVGTTQEEVSTFGKGAMISAYVEEPDYFIAVDTTIAADHPEVGEEESPIKLNAGPGIVLIERRGVGNIADKKLVDWVVKTSDKKRIPYQLEAIEGGATDASRVNTVRSGIPSIAVCTPTRYIHSNVGVASQKDIDHTANLLIEALKNVP